MLPQLIATAFESVGRWCPDRGMRPLALAAVVAVATMTTGQSAFAQRFYDGGNSQVWDSSTANWSLTTGGPYDQTWATGTAVFEGTAADVTISGTIANISGLRFDVAGYTLSGDSLPFPNHNSPLTVNADATISATISGAGGIRKEGTGTLVLSGSNTYTGATFLGVVSSAADAGVLSIGDVAALGTGTGNPGRINFVGNGTLRYTGSGAQAITTKDLFSDLANSSMTIDVSNATGSLTITPTSGTRNKPFTKSGPGALTMNGAFTTSATITANGGTLVLGADNSNTGATAIAAGATLQVGAGSTTGALGSGAISNAGTLVVNRSNALTMAQAISGAGSLVKEGAGTLTITANNSYSGGTTVSAGTLAVGAGSTSGTLPGNASVAGTLTFNRSNAVTYAGVLSGSGMLRKEATNTLTLTGDSTIAAATVVAGTLSIGSGGGAGSFAGTIANSGTITFDRTGSLTHAAAISGTGVVRKQGTGTVTLSAVNTYQGETIVSAGTLALSGAGDIAASAGLTLDGSGAGFDISAAGGNRTIGTLSGLAGSTITLGSNSLTAGTATSSTFAGGISGNGSLLKAGTGTLTLSGSNTYGGGTQVSNGTLLVNGELGTGTVSLGAGTTLGGSGTIAGTIAGAGTVSVGNSPGILTAASVDPTGGLGWDFEITGSEPAWAAATASVNDVLRLTDATSPFAASLTGANAVNFLFALPGGDPISAGTYTVGFFTDRSTSFAADVASAAVEYWVLGEFGSFGDRQQFNVGAGGSPVWYTRMAAYDAAFSASLSVVPMTADFGSGNVSGFSTSVVVVPEPSTLALAGLGLAAALATSLRHRRRGACRPTWRAGRAVGAMLRSGPLIRNFLARSGRVLDWVLATIVVAIAALDADSASAQVTMVVKAATGDQLATSASWVGGTLPSSSSGARWESTSLGGDLRLQTASTWALLDIQGAPADVAMFGATLRLNSGSFPDPATGTNVSSVGINLRNTAAVDLTLNNDITIGASQLWRIGSGRTLTVNGVVGQASNPSNTFQLITQFGGTVELMRNNTFLNGATNAWMRMDSGIVRVNAVANGGTASPLGQAGTGANFLVLNGGTLDYVGTGHATNRLFSMSANSSITSNGSGALNYTSTNSIAYTTANPGTPSSGRILTLGGANTNDNTFRPNLVDGTTASGLTKAGSGLWVVSGANTYSGNTLVNAGTLVVPAASSLPGWNSAGRWSVASGAALALGNSFTNDNIDTLLGTGNFVSGGSLGFSTAAGNRTYSAGLADTAAGPLGLVKSQANTLTLDAASTYSGGTKVVGGTLAASAANALGSGPVNVAAGATLRIGHADALATNSLEAPVSAAVSFTAAAGTSYTLGSVAGGFAIDVGGGAFIVGGDGHSTNHTGSITAAALTKTGPGTLTLGGSNTISSTTISGGTLLAASANALGAGPVTLAGGALQVSPGVSLSNPVILSGAPAANALRMDYGNVVVDFLVVGGGGGGASRDVGGGGGGGGVRTSVNGTLDPAVLPASGSYGVTVGDGGQAAYNDATGTGFGGAGGNSEFQAVTALGGGGGGMYAAAGGSGASGGGSGAAAGAGGFGTNGLGFAGGVGTTGSFTAGGGGGGAGGIGGTGTTVAAGSGGNGIQVNIAGLSEWYGGGGGGAGHRTNNPDTPSGSGGLGGGGAGAAPDGVVNPGVANTGGGGGAARSVGTNTVGGAGGSGVVILRYAGGPIATGGTIDTSSLPGFTLHRFTEPGAAALEFTPNFLLATSLSGVISGDGGFAWDSPAVLTLSGQNTYTGGTVISGGTVVAGSAVALGSGAVTVNAGGRLRLDQGSVIANAIPDLGSGSFAGSLEFAGGGLARTSTAGNDTLGTVLAGSLGSAASLNPAISWLNQTTATASDILQLNNTAGTAQVLSLNYDPIRAPASLQEAYLGWFDTSTTDWVNAIDGNSGGTGSFFHGSWADYLAATPGATPTSALGVYGHDPASATVWAVVDHNSDFAVIIVPEPGTLALAGLGLAAAFATSLRHRRR